MDFVKKRNWLEVFRQNDLFIKSSWTLFYSKFCTAKVEEKNQLNIFYHKFKNTDVPTDLIKSRFLKDLFSSFYFFLK